MPHDAKMNGHNGNLRSFDRVDSAEDSPLEDEFLRTCDCHQHDYPPWTGEIHGMSQALLSKSRRLRFFWWMVLFVCASLGTTTTIRVIIEYTQGPTATSTTIRLVPSLKLPAITVCPKIPNAFDFDEIYKDIHALLPELDEETGRDLIRYWLGGSGLENISPLQGFNRTYLDQLDRWHKIWSNGYEYKEFFDMMQAKYGYKCQDLFHYCELGGKSKSCCDDLFQPRSVMRRGLCHQTRNDVNQTEADDIGRLVLRIKAPTAITSPEFNYTQPQMIIYVNDNYDHALDFPRFYLYPDEWNRQAEQAIKCSLICKLFRMHFTARLVELLEHPEDCTSKIIGRDTSCFVRNWVTSNLIDPYNCTVPYLTDIPGVPNLTICDPSVIAKNYYNTIEVVHAGSVHSQECIPGCQRWEYGVSLQQSAALDNFVGYKYNLEASFYDLQYEHVKEVPTTSVPGFMSQIGGQFGFFLGLSIITMLQIVIYGVSWIVRFFYTLFKPPPVVPLDALDRPMGNKRVDDNYVSSWM